MTPVLRKVHRRIWTASAVLLPLLILTGTAVLPRSGPVIMPRMGEEEAAMDLNRIGESNGIIVWHGLSVTGVTQIGIEINSVFESASALVFLTGSDHKELLIGKLNHSGLTFFEIPSGLDLRLDTILIKDAIKQRLLVDIPLHLK